MIEAFLYNRTTRTVSALAHDDILETRPATPEETNGAANGLKSSGKPRETVKGAFRGTLPRCREGETLWLDVTDPNAADYQLISERFGLHEMVLEDLRTREGRPKLHDYGEYLYVIFHALSYEQRHESSDDEDDEETVSHADAYGNRYVLVMNEIDCLVGSDYVITLHEEPLQPLKDLQKRCLHNPNLMRPGTSYLLYEIMDEVLDDYFPLLDALDERIDELEDRLFRPAPRNFSSDIFALKRTMVRIRRIAGPMRDVVNVLLRRDADAGGKHFVYYQDLYDHAARIVDISDSLRDILSGALDAYLAMASNRLNEVMKTMTAASIMLLVPNLVAAIYGMNFENMPELKLPYGYFMTLGGMAAAVAAMFYMFKRKGWL